MIKHTRSQQSIILFDGVCNLCNSSVIFVLRQERQPAFQFASLQSEVGQHLLVQCGLPANYIQTVILIDQGKIRFGSTAALKIAQTLKFPWWVLGYLGFLVPKCIRDRIYSWIAAHRYHWFGKRDTCMVPAEDLKKRFL